MAFVFVLFTSLAARQDAGPLSRVDADVSANVFLEVVSSLDDRPEFGRQRGDVRLACQSTQLSFGANANAGEAGIGMAGTGVRSSDVDRGDRHRRQKQASC